MTCWIWDGALSHNGYGRARVDGRMANVHRAAYEALVEPVPAGLQIDHLCFERRCYNPAHLEVVTPAENRRRSAARITSCPAGHLYDDENTYITAAGARSCRTCTRLRKRARDAQRRGGAK